MPFLVIEFKGRFDVSNFLVPLIIHSFTRSIINQSFLSITVIFTFDRALAFNSLAAARPPNPAPKIKT